MSVARQQLATVCTSHCWSPNGDRLALCANSNTVLVYGVRDWQQPWQKVATLAAHRGRVTDVDWSAITGRIITCSVDRCCYVWQEGADNSWDPTLAVVQLQLAALCVRWSPDGAAFAVGSTDKSVCIGFHEQGMSWVAKSVRRKHSSSVTGVAWHPSQPCVATCSTDGHCRLLGATVPGVSGESSPEHLRLGHLLLDADLQAGWGHAVAWCPTGTSVAVACHSSCIMLTTGLDVSKAAQDSCCQRRIDLPALPARSLAFLGQNLLVAGGWGCKVYLFEQELGGLRWHQRSWKAGKQSSLLTPGKGHSPAFASSLARFRSPGAPAKKAHTPTVASEEGVADLAHANCIVDCRVMGPQGGIAVSRLSSCGWDGRVCIWEVDMQSADSDTMIAALHV